MASNTGDRNVNTTNEALADEGEQEEFGLRNEFDAAEKIVDITEADSATTQNDIRQAVAKLQVCSKCVSILGLFSRNESLEDVATSALRYLIIPAYLAYLSQRLHASSNDDDSKNEHHGSQQNRAAVVSAALDYYRQFFMLCKDYKISGINYLTSTTLLHELQNGDEFKHYENSAENNNVRIKTDAQRRSEKIQRYQRRRELAEKIKYLQQKQSPQSIDQSGDAEYYMRSVWLDKLELWLIQSVEDAELLVRENSILQQMARMDPSQLADEHAERNSRSSNARTKAIDDHHNNGSTSSSSVTKLDKNSFRSLIVPVRLLRAEEQKKVFGAGYPSLPKYTIEEYYDMMASTGKLPENGGPIPNTTTNKGSQVTRIELSEADGEEARRAQKDDEVDRDDEQALKKARDWDEFKDDNPRGWGNRKNKG